nr:hypothetical protein [Tanacetum cinerariifolium]
MNYLEEKADGEAMINSIQNGDQPLPVIAQVSLAGNAQNAPPTLKDPKFWTAEEKNTRKIDRLARSLLIQGLPNDIYSLIDSNKTAKDLWDALERKMLGSEYAEQDRKAAILYDDGNDKGIMWYQSQGEYSQWRERFMNYLEEQTDGEATINSIQNGDQPLPVIAQVSLAENAQNAPPTLKDPKFWTAKEKKTRKIDRLARSLLIQGLPNDIYSFINSNETAKDLWDAFERQMCYSEYGEQDRKAAILYEYKTFKAIEGEQMEIVWYTYEANKKLMDINIDDLYNILKQNQGDVNDALGYKKKAVVVTSDLLALVAEKIKVSKQKEKVIVSLDSEGSGADDFSELKKINALLAKAFNRRNSDSDQEINANMVFMAQIEKVLSESNESSSFAEETIAEVRRNDILPKTARKQ